MLYDAPQLGMLPQLNSAFYRSFKDTAARAKQDIENDHRFIELRDHVVHDLVENLDFEKTDDDDDDQDYNNETVYGYFVMFLHATKGTVVYVSRGDDACGFSVRVSAENFGWEDFEVLTPEEWDEKYAPIMERTPPPSSSESSDEEEEE
jgi:hypothetical protein